MRPLLSESFFLFSDIFHSFFQENRKSRKSFHFLGNLTDGKISGNIYIFPKCVGGGGTQENLEIKRFAPKKKWKKWKFKGKSPSIITALKLYQVYLLTFYVPRFESVHVNNHFSTLGTGLRLPSRIKLFFWRFFFNLFFNYRHHL